MDKNEIGLGIAGFLLSLSTIIVLIKTNVFTSKEVDIIIAASRDYLKGPASLVGSQDTVLAAEEALQVAERAFRFLLAPPTTSA
jgi:hypothetical protein